MGTSMINRGSDSTSEVDFSNKDAAVVGILEDITWGYVMD